MKMKSMLSQPLNGKTEMVLDKYSRKYRLWKWKKRK